jgi:hypothetical protein
VKDGLDKVWDGRSVLFTSFWGWSPDTWGTVGWTKEIGRGRRDNLLREVSDPFIVACYVTLSAPDADEHERGKLTGFYLVSHETGDRDEFTDPSHHALEPDKWRHSVRAVRAFDYVPEYRLDIREFDPTVLKRAQTVAAMGELVTDQRRLDLLQNTPYQEVRVYTPRRTAAPGTPASSSVSDDRPGPGFVAAGPENAGGYFVPDRTRALCRHLYILRLDGPTDAFLGKPAAGRRIVKVGLAASPETRRCEFQRALPRGAFAWRTHRTTIQTHRDARWPFAAAEAGEYAMKRFLASCAEHLEGEFYLASDEQISEAWQLGVAAAKASSARY